MMGKAIFLGIAISITHSKYRAVPEIALETGQGAG
jgi:hypothetical protein